MVPINVLLVRSAVAETPESGVRILEHHSLADLVRKYRNCGLTKFSLRVQDSTVESLAFDVFQFVFNLAALLEHRQFRHAYSCGVGFFFGSDAMKMSSIQIQNSSILAQWLR